MKAVLQIPSDVGEYCRKAAAVLTAENERLGTLCDLWADTDPDPENGFFWSVQMDHPEVARLRGNLTQTAQFLDWLAQHGAHGKPIERTHDGGAA